LRQLREVHFEHIRLDHIQVGTCTQAHGQVAVQFDDCELAQPLDQRLRERGQTGPDFNHGLARLRIDGLNDGLDDPAVAQEMLPKTFARNVLHWGGSRIST
jgi:hypothetical protein